MTEYLYRILSGLRRGCNDFLYGFGNQAPPRFLRNNLVSIYEDFLALSEHFSKEQIVVYQNISLRKIVINAYNHTDFYKNWFEINRINPNLIKTIDDLKSIPPIEKRDFRNFSTEKRIAKNIPSQRQIFSKTSGSSGEPFIFFFDRQTLPLLAAFWRRFLRWHDIGREAPKILIADPLLRRINDYVFRISIFDIFKKPDEVLKDISKANGYVLVGYASGLKELAYLVAQRGIKYFFPKILSFAELLTEGDRYYIEKIFGGEVYGFYGAAEFGIIAQECRQRNGFHINEEGCVVEVIDDKELPVGFGRLIITSLTNEVMPLIRYSIGDVGKIDNGECGCGVNLKKIHIIGRKSSVFNSSIRKIHEFEFNNILGKYGREIHQFAVFQKSDSHLIISVVANNWNKAIEEEIIKELKNNIDNRLHFSIKRVEHIDRSSRGKLIKIRPDFV